MLDFSTLLNGEVAENDGTDNMYFQKAKRDLNGILTVDVIFPYSPKTYKGDMLSSLEVIEGDVNPYGVAL